MHVASGPQLSSPPTPPCVSLHCAANILIQDARVCVNAPVRTCCSLVLEPLASAHERCASKPDRAILTRSRNMCLRNRKSSCTSTSSLTSSSRGHPLTTRHVRSAWRICRPKKYTKRAHGGDDDIVPSMLCLEMVLPSDSTAQRTQTPAACRSNLQCEPQNTNRMGSATCD